MKQYLIPAVIAAVIAFGAVAYFASLQGNAQPLGGGSAVGPEDSNPYHCINGQCTYYPRGLTATSSTIFSYKNVTGATTTIAYLGCTLSGAAAGNPGIAAQTLDVSTSTTAYASSSPQIIKAFSIPAQTGTNASGFGWSGGTASTTGGVLGYDTWNKTGQSPYRVAPGEFLNFTLATGTPGTFGTYYKGACSAQLIQN